MCVCSCAHSENNPKEFFPYTMWFLNTEFGSSDSVSKGTVHFKRKPVSISHRERKSSPRHSGVPPQSQYSGC